MVVVTHIPRPASENHWLIVSASLISSHMAAISGAAPVSTICILEIRLSWRSSRNVISLWARKMR